MGGAIGDAKPADVVKGKTFSSQESGKGVKGTLIILPPSPQEQSFTNSIGMTFNLIPAGTFVMGSPVSELARKDDETLHPVTLTKPFHMQTTEVTQAQWDAVITDKGRGSNPSNYSAEGHPVEGVNWFEAASFANWLSHDEGLTVCYNPNGSCTGTLGVNFACTNVTLYPGCIGYRLPTEAQWEYAARAGTSTAFYNGNITTHDDCTPLDPNLDKIGWYCGNSYDTTHFVAWKHPNEWGLYDMSGNVYELCNDWYQTNYYMLNESQIDPNGQPMRL